MLEVIHLRLQNFLFLLWQLFFPYTVCILLFLHITLSRSLVWSETPTTEFYFSHDWNGTVGFLLSALTVMCCSCPCPYFCCNTASKSDFAQLLFISLFLLTHPAHYKDRKGKLQRDHRFPGNPIHTVGWLNCFLSWGQKFIPQVVTASRVAQNQADPCFLVYIIQYSLCYKSKWLNSSC